MSEDELRANSWFQAIDHDQTYASDVRRRSIMVAKAMLIAMCRQPHLYQKPRPLPEAFSTELTQHGLTMLEKAARKLAGLGAVNLKVARASAKPMMIDFALSPEKPLI